MKPMILQKPLLPGKQLEMIKPVAAAKFNSKNLQENVKFYAKPVNQIKQQIAQQDCPVPAIACSEGEDNMAMLKARRTPRVLDKPQYACFLHATNQDIKYPIQRSRSNEFQKTFSSCLSSNTHVSRSNSLRNLDNFALSWAHPITSSSTTSTTTNNAAHALYFSAEVNSKKQFSLTPTNIEKAKTASNAYQKSPTATLPTMVSLDQNCREQMFTYRSQSFLNLPSHNQEFPEKSKEFEFKSQSLSDLAYKTKTFESPYNANATLIGSYEQCIQSRDNFNSSPSSSIPKAKSVENVTSSVNYMNSHLATLQKSHFNYENNLASLSQNLLEICDHTNESNANDIENHDLNNLAALDDLNNTEMPVKALENLLPSVFPENSLKVLRTKNNSTTDLTLFSENPNESLDRKVKSLENLDIGSKTLKYNQNNEVNRVAISFDSVKMLKNDCKTPEEKTENANLALPVHVQESEIEVVALECLNSSSNSQCYLEYNLEKYEKNCITDLAAFQDLENGNSSVVSGDFSQKTVCKALNVERIKNVDDKATNLAALENSKTNVNQDSKTENEEGCRNNCLEIKKSEHDLSEGEDALKSVKESEDILSVTVNTENTIDCKSKALPKKEYKSPQTLSVTINTDYLTAYSSSVKHRLRNSKPDMFDTENSFSLNFNQAIEIKKQSKSEENLTSHLNPFEKAESNAKSMSCENFSDVIEYDLHKNVNENFKLENEKRMAPLETSKEIPKNSEAIKTINLAHLNKSLQMSLDSLDDYEDALATNTLDERDAVSQAYNSKYMDASEILEDIAVGIDSRSLFDFNNLLTLKRSRTEYCLKDLTKPKSFSMDSVYKNERKDADTDDDENEEIFNSACNTLESKASLKPNKIQEIQETIQIISKSSKAAVESPSSAQQSLNKSSKTLRSRTAEKILHFTHHASQNVSSSYSTFRKSKNFYKNASKSFKNSLKFYETFNEKPASQLNLAALQQTPMNCSKKAEQNRKLFSKSSKLNKSKPHENPESPTENSYSFEYFDAESDRNGNIITAAVAIDKENQELNQPLKENEKTNEVNKPSTTESNNLKPPFTNKFYFNSSPRPFKRIYITAPSLVSNEELLSGQNSNKTQNRNPNAWEPKTAPTGVLTSSFKLKPFKASSTELQSSTVQIGRNSFLEPCVAAASTTLSSNSFSVADSIKFFSNSEDKTRHSFSLRSLQALENPLTAGCHLEIPIKEAPSKFSTNKLALSHRELGSRGCTKKEISTLKETNGNPVNLDNSFGSSLNPDTGKTEAPFISNLYMATSATEKNSESSSNHFNPISEDISSCTSKIYTNTKYLELKTKTPTLTTPTTLMVKDLTKPNTTTTRATTFTTTTTNFPTKVVVLKQQTIAKNISYTTCSTSSSSSISTLSPMIFNKKLFNAATTSITTNVTAATGKYYHPNLKATIPPPLPSSAAPSVPLLKKKFTTEPSAKVLTQRKDNMTTKCTTTTTANYSSITTTTATITPPTRTTICLKTSTPTSYCSSGNRVIGPAPPLRRRIPGNTLYYV